MDRATFEKIVGGDVEIVFCGKEPYATAYATKDWKDDRSFTVQLTNATPFQVRCGCFAIGIKCDWDEPVSFERLMELEGAVNVNKEFESITFANPYQELRFSKKLMHDDREEWFCTASSEAFFLVKTMRQVHLLLEAAVVGE